MYRRGTWFRLVLGQLALLHLLACIVPAAPSLEGWLCESDADCQFGLRCCASTDQNQAGQKLCSKECKECEANQTRPCYAEGKESFAGKGICQYGQEICTPDGEWSGACQKAIYPSIEVCNQKDDDCDGKVDNGIANCECVRVGESRPCYSVQGVDTPEGECQKGSQKCEANNTWGACVGEITPEKEVCDNKDNDCNGQIDDNLIKECTGPCGKGEEVCRAGKWSTCSAAPQTEECNGKDDDCDGEIDNVNGTKDPLSKECYSGPADTKGKGACQAGKQLCLAATWSACQGEVVPAVKNCNNNKDNDCDGKVDVDCSCPVACSENSECAVSGCGDRIVCKSGKCVAACVESCLDDSDCAEPSCGPLSRCLNSVCSALSCPSICTLDIHCKIGPCGSKTACRGGVCAEPLCPSSCNDNKDCAIANCGGRTACGNGVCTEPCKADSRYQTSCTAGFGPCQTTGKYVCSSDNQTVTCDAQPDLSKKQPEETCNDNIDDDCDGIPDDGCSLPKADWVVSFQTSGSEQVNYIDIDSSGAIYVAGWFYNAMTIGQDTITPKGSSDIFFAKLDSSGSVKWLKSFGGTGNDNVLGLKVDAKGAIYITGKFENAITFASKTYTSKGKQDAFVAKFDNTGKEVWFQALGGTGEDEAHGVTTDASDNVYVTGFFSGSVSAGTKTLTSLGDNDVFVMSLTSAGAYRWAMSGGTTSPDRGLGIGVDTNGNVYNSGIANNGATFGTFTVPSTGGTYVIRLKQSDGTVNRAQKGGATLISDKSGNLYFAGSFWGSLTLGSITLTAAGSTSAEADLMGAKMDAAGNWVWGDSLGGSLREGGNIPALGPNGEVFIAGSFASASLTVPGGTLNNQGMKDALVTRQNPTTGKFDWATGFGSTGDDFAIDVAVDASGNLYIVGGYSGSIKLRSKTISHTGGRDGFVIKIAKSDMP